MAVTAVLIMMATTIPMKPKAPTFVAAEPKINSLRQNKILYSHFNNDDRQLLPWPRVDNNSNTKVVQEDHLGQVLLLLLRYHRVVHGIGSSYKREMEMKETTGTQPTIDVALTTGIGHEATTTTTTTIPAVVNRVIIHDVLILLSLAHDLVLDLDVELDLLVLSKKETNR